MNPSPNAGAPFVTPTTGSALYEPPVHTSGERPASSPYVYQPVPSQPVIVSTMPQGSGSLYVAPPPPPSVAPPPKPRKHLDLGGMARGALKKVTGKEKEPQPQAPVTGPAFDLEATMHHNVQNIIDESSKNASSVDRWRRFAVATASVLDLVSTFTRVSLLALLELQPADYIKLTVIPVHAAWYHAIVVNAILFLTVAGIGFGAPAALLSSVFRAVSTTLRLDDTANIPNKARRKEARRDARSQMIGSYFFVFAAFVSLALLAVPTFLATNPNITPAQKQLIGEGALIVLPVMLMIVLLFTERDLLMSMKQAAGRVATYGGLFAISEASVRLAHGVGSSRDALAVTGGLNGRLDKVLAAGVAVPARDQGITYVTLGDIQVLLGGTQSKDDPRRRGLSRVAREAMGTNQYGIYLDAKTGYMIPRDFVPEVFGEYAKKHPATSFATPGVPGSSQVEKRWSKGGMKQVSGVDTASDEGGQLVAKTFLGRLLQIFISPEKAS